MTTIRCMHCQAILKTAYVREGKTWKRVGWWCPRCNEFEKPDYHKFRPNRKGGFIRQ